MQPEIVLTDAPSDEALRVISASIVQFNAVHSGRPNDYRPLVLVVSDPATKQPIGGLVGWTSFSYLHIQLLYLPDSLRGTGLGSQLLALAETEALARGCHAAWLDTFSFQARGFYEKLGYTLFGTLEGYPPGHSRFFLRKSLTS